VRIHFARKHPLELELCDRPLQSLDIVLHGSSRILVLLGLREVEQCTRIGETLAQLVEGADDRFELRALATELLCTLGLAPDRRVLELSQDLGQALAAPLVVKGTP